MYVIENIVRVLWCKILWIHKSTYTLACCSCNATAFYKYYCAEQLCGPWTCTVQTTSHLKLKSSSVQFCLPNWPYMMTKPKVCLCAMYTTVVITAYHFIKQEQKRGVDDGGTHNCFKIGQISNLLKNSEITENQWPTQKLYPDEPTFVWTLTDHRCTEGMQTGNPFSRTYLAFMFKTGKYFKT